MPVFPRSAVILAAALAQFSITSVIWADDVTDQLDKVRSAYAAHDLRGAQKALGDAEGLIRQQRLVQWKTVLPDALGGWTAENVEGTAAAIALLGGGVSVSRRYRKGGASLTIEIVADSPIVASMTPMIRMLSTLGGETVSAGGNIGVYRKDDHSIMATAADKALVTVKGQGASDDDLKAYFKAIKFDAIAALLK